MHPNSSIGWSAYPALLLAGAFTLGISVRHAVGGPEFSVWALATVAGVGGYAAARWWGRQKLVSLAPLFRVITVFLIGLCIGGARHAVFQHSSPQAVEQVAQASPQQAFWIRGMIDDAPERAGSTTRFTLAVDSVGRRPPRKSVGKVRVTLRPSPWDDRDAAFPQLHQGDRVRIRGEIQSAPGQRNPGGFDYGAYLSRRGICCTSFVSDPTNVVVVSRNRGTIDGLIVEARRHIRHQLDRYVPGTDARAVLQALLLGDRSGIRDSIEERFAETGLMHLLAVSGLHVFLVGMVLYVLLQPVLMRFRLRWRTVEIGRAVLTVVVLGFYVFLTGARPSVVRAVVMASLFIGGILFQRSSHPLNTLGVAALVLLAIRPAALFDVGFQLSMAAVAALVTVHPRLMEGVPASWTARPGGEWLVSTVSTSAAATIGAAPVLLFHFGWVSGAGLLLNVVGIPCTGIAMSAAVAMVAVGGIWSVAGAAFGSMADVAVDGLLLASRGGAEWLGWWGLRIGDPSAWVLGALVVGTVAVAQWPRPRHRWRCLICAFLLLVGGIWWRTIGADAEPTLDVLFFDVGQGDAVLVTTPNDRRMLVDTGPRSPAGGAVAQDAILPYLRQRGVDRLDTVIISHPDEDHLGGLPAILREFTVGRVIHSGQESDTELYRETRRRLQRNGVRTAVGVRNDTLNVGSSLAVQILGPPPRPSHYGIKSENGKSVVVRIAYGHVDILLPGDVEGVAERALVRSYGRQLGSRIVKIPHHGSETSSTKPFVDQVVDSTHETDAVVSVGQSNSFGMPDPSVMKRWGSAGADVRSTANAGAVWLRTNGREVWKVEWQ